MPVTQPSSPRAAVVAAQGRAPALTSRPPGSEAPAEGVKPLLRIFSRPPIAPQQAILFQLPAGGGQLLQHYHLIVKTPDVITLIYDTRFSAGFVRLRAVSAAPLWTYSRP
jgi:hypothetical protein